MPPPYKACYDGAGLHVQLPFATRLTLERRLHPLPALAALCRFKHLELHAGAALDIAGLLPGAGRAAGPLALVGWLLPVGPPAGL
jgi:hypothetical protein